MKLSQISSDFSDDSLFILDTLSEDGYESSMASELSEAFDTDVSTVCDEDSESSVFSDVTSDRDRGHNRS